MNTHLKIEDSDLVIVEHWEKERKREREKERKREREKERKREREKERKREI